jgi:hypothetical protein
MNLLVAAAAEHTSEVITTRLDTYKQAFTRLLARGCVSASPRRYGSA